ncbi:MAG: AzlC family ABC transporter permease [Ruminococcaceae bacterium]|nr:AzlC family ABC transporter permease [Oscillospiraceae bacterium]
MRNERLKWFKLGFRHGIPIMLGYFAVSFTLGIAAREAGITAFQAGLTSALINASAGEYIGFTLIAANAGYFEVLIMEAVANARYLLMSCALSQKLPPDTPLRHRLIVGFYITDEIFSVSYAQPGMLKPWYTFGAAAAAAPGWAFGTALGVIVGDILPLQLVSALGVGLYGMFIASFIPPAKSDRLIAGLVVVSFAASFLFSKVSLPWLTDGVKIILLTVVISLIAAILFPVKEKSPVSGEKEEIKDA